MTPKKTLTIEINTRNQRLNPIWFEERQWRLTASRFGEICKATERRNMDKLCESLYSPSVFQTASVGHGQTYEPVAINRFQQAMGVKVEACGFFVDQDAPFLGASPDGLCTYNGTRMLVEVKCPFNGREENIAPGPHFDFLEQKSQGGRSMRLKRNHNYYYQVMGQMAVSKVHECMFVVYTHKELFLERIAFDKEFYFNEIYPKLEAFFHKFYKPFIALHAF